ncbi:DUF5131 family protein [Methylocaldum sp. MU1018]
MTINHKNGIKTDNRPENLELATCSEQHIHALRVRGSERGKERHGETAGHSGDGYQTAEGERREIENHTPTIRWCVVGGESGPNARPMHPEWVRSLRD